MEVWRDVTSIFVNKMNEGFKNIIFLLFFITVFSILFSITFAQDDIYPKILSYTPQGSTRPHWAGDYPIPGFENETFSVTYNETNMTKVMLFWKEFDNEMYNNITLSGCSQGENETCSVDLDLSMYPNGTVIVYDFVVYDENSCSLDPLLVEYEGKCGNSTGLPKNCLKEFQSYPGMLENCSYDMYKYPIIEGNLSVPPDTDYLRHVTIDRTPPPTTTTTSSSTTSTTTSTTTSPTTTTIITTTITLEERVRNLEERVSWLETLINLMKEAICSVSQFEGFEFCLDVTPTTTTTIPKTTTTTPTTLVSWGHSTCYSTCLKGTDVPYDPCHEYWAVTNLVDRGYCNWM